MTFREPTREMETTDVVSPALATEEPEAPVLAEEEAEELPPIPEEALTPLPAKGEDPVRLYLKEIGKVPLLTAQQEVQIGRRIEVGQIALRRALSGIPMAPDNFIASGLLLLLVEVTCFPMGRFMRRGILALRGAVHDLLR